MSQNQKYDFATSFYCPGPIRTGDPWSPGPSVDMEGPGSERGVLFWGFVTPGPFKTSESSVDIGGDVVFIDEEVVVSGVIISEGCFFGFVFFCPDLADVVVGCGTVGGCVAAVGATGAVPTVSPPGDAATETLLLLLGVTTG